MSSITTPIKRHAAISGCFAIPALIVAVVVAWAVGAYAIPEAWAVAVEHRDALTFIAVVVFGCVVVIWFGAPGAIAAKDAVDKYSEALEYDKHTRQDDKNPYGSYTVKDDGLYKGSRKVRNLSQGELDERKALADGGLSGYNAEINRAINEGRR